jgi:hypothetical protein
LHVVRYTLSLRSRRSAKSVSSSSKPLGVHFTKQGGAAERSRARQSERGGGARGQGGNGFRQPQPCAAGCAAGPTPVAFCDQHAHPHTHAPSHTRTLTHTHPHTHAPSHTRAHAHTRTRAHAHTRTPTHLKAKVVFRALRIHGAQAQLRGQSRQSGQSGVGVGVGFDFGVGFGGAFGRQRVPLAFTSECRSLSRAGGRGLCGRQPERPTQELSPPRLSHPQGSLTQRLSPAGARPVSCPPCSPSSSTPPRETTAPVRAKGEGGARARAGVRAKARARVRVRVGGTPLPCRTTAPPAPGWAVGLAQG